jgi:hypothetical protein
MTMTTTAISGRTRAETVSSSPPMTSPALARSSGMPHCAYRRSRVATSVGPGIVLATARPARSAPTACGHDTSRTRIRYGTAFAT